MKNFKDRFNLPDSIKEAEDRFINRASDFLKIFFDDYDTKRRRVMNLHYVGNILEETEEVIAFHLGKKRGTKIFNVFLTQNIFNCLETLEILSALLRKKIAANDYENFEDFIKQSVEREPLLNLRWINGYFLPVGALELDKKLVDDPLMWLSEYVNIRKPYSSCLAYLRRGESDENDLKSAIRDAYEALESLAKFVTKKFENDLSKNRELFVTELRLTPGYTLFLKASLKEYIKFANIYRHGNNEKDSQRKIYYHEVESFVYLTGVLLRLAVNQIKLI